MATAKLVTEEQCNHQEILFQNRLKSIKALQNHINESVKFFEIEAFIVSQTNNYTNDLINICLPRIEVKSASTHQPLNLKKFIQHLQHIGMETLQITCQSTLWRLPEDFLNQTNDRLELGKTLLAIEKTKQFTDDSFEQTVPICNIALRYYQQAIAQAHHLKQYNLMNQLIRELDNLNDFVGQQYVSEAMESNMVYH